jgi:hypothetical protein
MVSLIEIWRKYGPRIVIDSMMEGEEVMRELERRTGLNRGQVKGVLFEVENLKVTAMAAGRSLRLPTDEIYRPVMRRDGSINVSYRAPKRLKTMIKQCFSGKVLNACNIGKSDDQMIDYWNKHHPDNPYQRKT